MSQRNKATKRAGVGGRGWTKFEKRGLSNTGVSSEKRGVRNPLPTMHLTDIYVHKLHSNPQTLSVHIGFFTTCEMCSISTIK